MAKRKTSNSDAGQSTLPAYIEYTDLKELKTQELLVACPKNYYQIHPISKCKRCEFLAAFQKGSVSSVTINLVS